MGNNTWAETVGGKKAKTKVLGYRKVDGRKISVEQLPDKAKHGFIGGNKEAYKALKIKSNIKRNEVIVCKGQGKATAKRTIQHEIIEEPLMRYFRKHERLSKIDAYHKAHKLALKFEGTRKTPKEVLKWYKTHPR